MRKINKLVYVFVGLAITLCSACSDFFDADTDTVLKGDSYMKENSELYSGFLGIVTKIQAIGDKSIYLTDTRAELLEPTENTPGELYSLYNYDDDLSGNSYADPAKYYDVIISCNDYLQKAKEYKEAHESSIDMDHYKGLISSTLRLKTWIYFTLGKIYGKAVWFDDPMQSLTDISKFETKNLDEILEGCENLLNTGYDGVNGTYKMSWREWLDPVDASNVTSSTYDIWDLMVPEYFILEADLALWRGEYQRTVDLLLNEMNTTFAANRGNIATTKYMRSGSYSSQFGTWYDAATPQLWALESVIMYDYQYNQKNTLLQHFDYSSDYMLRASLVGVQRFKDITYNPPAKVTDKETSDVRSRAFKEIVANEEYSIQKYRGMRKAGHSVAHDDVQINIYHTADMYFMLVEALNNLGRYTEASVLMNQGVDKYFGAENVTWPGFTNDWTTHPDGGRRTYADAGIRGVCSVGDRNMQIAAEDATPTEQQEIKKHNDIELLKEAMLEFPCEGKTYSMMIRVAKRWNDYTIISDFVCPKYTDLSKQAEVKNKIENNGAYFVPWDLRSTATH